MSLEEPVVRVPDSDEEEEPVVQFSDSDDEEFMRIFVLKQKTKKIEEEFMRMYGPMLNTKMSLEELVVQFPNCKEEVTFTRVFDPHMDGTGKSWAKLMRAFERQGLLDSKSALWAMLKAPIPDCREDVYSWYFQVIGKGDLSHKRRKIVHDLWKNGGDERKVFAGICRWLSESEVQAFLRTYENDMFDMYLHIGVYWSAGRRSVFRMFIKEITDGRYANSTLFIAKNVMTYMVEIMPDARKARPAGALGITPRDFREWDRDGDNPNSLSKEMFDTYNRETMIIMYFLRLDTKVKEMMYNFTSIVDLTFPSLLGRACDCLALPVANILVNNNFKYRGKILKKSEEKDSLLEKTIYKIFVANYGSPSKQKAAASSTSRSSATPHAQLQAHAKKLLEISKSLESLLHK